MFDDDLIVKEGDSFFDVLDRKFAIICANALYQQDPTCSFSFALFDDAKVVLGIQADDFEIITDWNNTFLAFEYFDGKEYRITSYGPSHLDFSNREKIRIIVRSSTGG